MVVATSDLELHEWLTRRPGRTLARMEMDELRAELRPLAGRQMVQVGSAFGHVDPFSDYGEFLQRSRVVSAVAPAHYGRDDVVVGRGDDLPFQSDSVNALVLPHALELAEEPHKVIREAHRVLAPEGYLILSGFNPWSLAGSAKLVMRRPNAPWQSRWFGAGRVRDWLALLGFQPISARQGWLRRTGHVLGYGDADAHLFTGQAVTSFAAGVYVLAARKKVVWMRPIVSRWRVRRPLSTVGLAETSAQVSSGDE